MIFASDNWAGASDKVVAAVAEAARRGGPAYGSDPLTAAVEKRFAEIFEHDVAVFLVGTGTVANSLSLGNYGRPGAMVLCHREAHILVDEPGSTELFGNGSRPFGMDGVGGRIEAANLKAALARFPDGNTFHGNPVALTLTELTELGVAYRPDEIAGLAAIAHGRGLAVHMDGARFAGAVAGLGVAPADLTWRAGIDVMSFGGTKNGCLLAEAVVFFDRAAASHFAIARQRAGQTFSKGWFIAAQFEAYLAGGHWLDLARHANARAKELVTAIDASSAVRLALRPDGNELFVVIDKGAAEKLTGLGAVFHPWATSSLPAGSEPGPDEILIRLVTSFSTTAEQIARFAEALAKV